MKVRGDETTRLTSSTPGLLQLNPWHHWDHHQFDDQLHWAPKPTLFVYLWARSYAMVDMDHVHPLFVTLF